MVRQVRDPDPRVVGPLPIAADVPFFPAFAPRRRTGRPKAVSDKLPKLSRRKSVR